MKSRKLYNRSTSTVVLSNLENIDGFPLVIQPNGCAAVSEETFRSPVLRPYLGRSLFESRIPEVLPKPEVPPKIQKSLPIEQAVIQYSVDLRNEYLKAPGVTEENVDSILAKYPSKERITEASKKGLTACGVAKSYTSRLKEWAKEPTIPVEE